jgi:hypothetical protein
MASAFSILFKSFHDGYMSDYTFSNLLMSKMSQLMVRSARYHHEKEPSTLCAVLGQRRAAA